MMSAFLPSPTSNRLLKNFIFFYLPEIWRCGGVPIKICLQKATPYLGESIEQKSFKNIFFFSHPIINKKQIVIKFCSTPNTSVQQLLHPLISKPLSPYSLVSSFPTPRSESTKWRTNSFNDEPGHSGIHPQEYTVSYFYISYISISFQKFSWIFTQSYISDHGWENSQIYGVHEVPRRRKSPRMFIINPSQKETTHSSGSVFSKIYFPLAKTGKGKKLWLIPWLKPKKNTYLILSMSV